MSATTHSMDQVILVGLVVGVIAAILTWRSGGGLRRLILGLVAVGALTPSIILYVGRNPWLVDARYRTFMMLWWNIRIGMTQEEVQNQIKSLYPPNGQQKPPLFYPVAAGKMEIQLAPEVNDTPGHESIILKIQGDQVLGIKYQARE